MSFMYSLPLGTRADWRHVCRVLPAMIVALTLVAPMARAQPSTAKLWPDRPWVVDVAAGPEVGFLTGGFGSSDGREGRAYGVMGAVRARLATHVFLGATAWRLGRSSKPFTAQGGTRTDHVTTIGFEAMLGLPVYRRVRLSATGGLGAAISVTSSGAPPGGPSRPGSGTGTMPMFGATLEVGRLQFSQKALILLGADDVVTEFREYFPLTVGWRF